MIETVTVTPMFGNDSNGDPIDPGEPYDLTPTAIAPGNTVRSYGQGGDLDEAEFTLFFRLKTWRPDAQLHQDTTQLVKDNYAIHVRDRDCFARVQVWRSPRTGRGGVVVLCTSATGQAA